MVARMNYGNLAGTLILLLIFAALFNVFDTGVTFIVNHTTGITSQLALLIIPLVILLLMQNIWSEDGGR